MIPASHGFDVDEMAHIIAYTPHVKFFAAPTMVMRLVDGWRGEQEPVNLKSIIYGGGPMYVADCLRALECFGARLVQIYGQGEAPMTITVLPASDQSMITTAAVWTGWAWSGVRNRCRGGSARWQRSAAAGG